MVNIYSFAFQFNHFLAVEIIATVKQNGNPDRIIIVKQYRPPLKKISVEFPAGLIDPNETPEVASLRELEEETWVSDNSPFFTNFVRGYKGSLKSISPVLSLEPGLTNATTVMAYVDIVLDSDVPPKQDLQEDEFIEVLLVPRNELLKTLHGKENLKLL